METKPPAYALVVVLAMPGLVAAQTVTRAVFIPPVISATWTNSVKFAATLLTQTTNLGAPAWVKRFYQTHPDRFDFPDFVLVGGRTWNRYRFNTRSAATGIGGGTNELSALFGSAGWLMGYNVLPFSACFDGGEKAFSRETGHQIQSTFNSLELYLMGMVPAFEVPTYFVLTNQNQNATNGRILAASEIQHVTIGELVGTLGPLRVDGVARQGIRYRTQASSNLVDWINVGAPRSLTLTNPPAETAVSMPLDPGGDGSGCTCYRLAVEY